MAPRPDPAETRELILEAARRCFARKGYYRTSMDDIVAESGLSKGTLYWHFENKRALFLALFDRLMGEVFAPTEEIMSGDAPVSERLRRLGVAVSEAIAAHPEFAAVPANFLLELWQDEEFARHYLAMLESLVEQTEALLQEGIERGEFRPMDVHEVTWGLMALYDGIILYHMIGLPGDLKTRLVTMTDLVVEGMRKRDNS